MYTFASSRASTPRRRKGRGMGDASEIPQVIAPITNSVASLINAIRGPQQLVYPGLYPATSTALLPAGSTVSPYCTPGSPYYNPSLCTTGSNPLGLTDSELLIGGVAGVALLAALMR